MKSLIFFLIISSIIHFSLASCFEKLEKCQTNFFDELKQIKLNDHETAYYDICSSNGTYIRFVECVRQSYDQCQPISSKFCQTRKFKIATYRYTWRPSLIHDLCYQTSPLLNQDFFKHEKCISLVLNKSRWTCDVEHYEKIKKNQGSDVCQHWKNFRSCMFEKVEEQCSTFVANLSDYLFHAHNSYFSKYTMCDLPGEQHTKCWFDSFFTSNPTTTISLNTKPMVQNFKIEQQQPTTTTESLLKKIQNKIKTETTSTVEGVSDKNLSETEAIESAEENEFILKQLANKQKMEIEDMKVPEIQSDSIHNKKSTIDIIDHTISQSIDDLSDLKKQKFLTRESKHISNTNQLESVQNQKSQPQQSSQEQVPGNNVFHQQNNEFQENGSHNDLMSKSIWKTIVSIVSVWITVVVLL